jgi:predicted aspartyl protease
MPDNIYHYAFDAEFSGIPIELTTEAMIFPSPAFRDSKGIKTSVLWDTGATHSCLSPKIVQSLGLKPVDTTTVHGVNSSQVADVVIASIGLTNGLFLADRRFSVSNIPGIDVLIGMDIIMLGDFAISNGGGKTRFSFAIPPFKNKPSFAEKADDINDRLSRNKK